MKKRNPAAVLLLPFVTFGIYNLVWFVKTKNEMNKLGAEIPTAWLIIIPFVNIYWMYKYSVGVDHVTGGKMSAVLAFILLWILGPIGSCIVQVDFNKVADGATPAAAAPSAPVTPAAPTPVAPAATATTTEGGQTPTTSV